MRPLFATPRRLGGVGRWLGVLALAAVVALPATAQRNVTLRMNAATMPDTIKADIAGNAQVRGALGSGTALPGGGVIDWNANTTVRPTNIGGDYWEVQFQIPDNDPLNFKFYFDQSEQGPPNGSGIGGWEDGGNNWNIPAGTGDVTLDLHYFNKTGGDQAYDWRPFTSGTDSVAVWFRVYMNTDDAINKGYDASDGALVVGIRGDNAPGGSQTAGTTVDWGATNIRLRREATDASRPGYHLYSGRVAYPNTSIGQTQNYKFVFSDSNTDIGWENDINGGNRNFVVPANDTTLAWQFYSNSPAVVGTIATAEVSFVVDVRPLSDAGVFQVANDALQVRGGFNGWDCPDGNNDDCLLTRIPSTFNYVRAIPLTSVVGSDQTYKFFVKFDPAPTNVDIGYEEPLDTGGGNRNFVFEGSSQSTGTQNFNNIRAGNVIPSGRSVAVQFEVDMNRATTFAPRAFNPAVDTVAVQFEDPIWLASQGYDPDDPRLIVGSNGSLISGFRLNDPDGDLVYTGTFTVNGPTYNGIGYRYTFANDTDGILAEGRGGFDSGRRRYRYITDSGSTFAFARDAFRSSTEVSPWERNPTGTYAEPFPASSIAPGTADPFTVANEDGPGRSGELALGAIYPNPTSGLARVNVTTGRDEEVSVRVYDVTGRVVATVTESYLVAGTRMMDIDTRGLAAGVYVLRAEAGNEVATRRLTVLR
jgi:hypothetical protein